MTKPGKAKGKKRLMESSKKAEFRSAAGIILMTTIWGFAFVIVKDSLDYLPVTYILAFRFTIASVPLLILSAKRLKKYVTKKVLLEGLILGVLLFLSYYVQTWGCKFTTASKNAFLTATYVVMVPFLLWAVTKKKPDIYSFIASFLCIAGVALLSLTQGFDSMNIGDVLTLICALGFAVHLMLVKRYTEVHDPVSLAVLQLTVAAVLSWVIAPFTDGGFPLEGLLHPNVAWGMLYLGLLSTMVCYLLQNICQKYLPATTASLLLSTEAVFGTFFSVLCLGDIFTGRMVIGCVMIFFAIVISETKLKFLPIGGTQNV